MGNRNRVEFKVFGMRRSGMHAVIYWLARHFDEKVWFANDLASFNDPRAHRAEMPSMYEPEEFISPLDVDDFWDRDKGVLISSVEDTGLEDLDWEVNRQVVGGSDEFYSVLVMRDPFNLFASRYKLGMVLSKESLENWKKNAQEALGATSNLKNKIIVNFGKWVTMPGYRRFMEEQMQLDESDKGVDRVYGLGSSFMGLRRDGSGTEMKVNDRWRHYRDQPSFMNFFDKEAVRLAWSLFDEVPEPFRGMVI